MSSLHESIPRRHSSNKKHLIRLCLFVALAIAGIIIVNAVPAVKNFIMFLGEKIAETGWYGPLLLILFNGFVIIPLCLPYSVMEVIIALLIPNYFFAVGINLSSQVLGAIVVFLLVKYKLREKIREYLLHINFYKAFEKVLEKHPLRFSLMIRFTLLPIFLKNYGLAIPHNINFVRYMFPVILLDTFWAALSIFLLKKITHFTDFFKSTSSPGEKAAAFGALAISLLIIGYIIWYTRKIVLELKEESKHELDGLESQEDREEEEEKEDDISYTGLLNVIG